MRHPRTAWSVIVALGLAGMAGCAGTGDQPNPTTSTSPATSTSATTSTSTPSTSATTSTSTPSTSTPTGSTTSTSAPPSGFSTKNVSGKSRGIGLLTAIRTGGHGGYDRVVFEFQTAVPGYDVGYAKLPLHADPSDKIVPVRGDSAIAVRLFPGYTFDPDSTPIRKTYTGPNRLETGLSSAVEVVKFGEFEAVLNWAIGVNDRPPFKVTTLTSPPRLVIDVAS